MEKETYNETLLRVKNEVACVFNKQSGVPYKSWDEMIKLIHDKPDAICDRYEQVCKRYYSERLKIISPTDEEIQQETDNMCTSEFQIHHKDYTQKGFLTGMKRMRDYFINRK